MATTRKTTGQAGAKAPAEAHDPAAILKLALEALNTAPRFRVGDTDSYKIASRIDAALKAAEAPKLRKFRVLCAVTRAEWYEIEASDEDTARREAFCEGELVETGDTTDVTECDVEEVLS